jgi:hypothetical protein
MRDKSGSLWFVLVTVVAAAAIFVPAASASSAHGLLLPSCGATSYPFKPWGDGDAYCAFPNLGFESGKTSWTLSGNAAVVSGNEPWNVSGPGAHALQLGPGATATSSPLPVSLLDPWIRFFAHSNSANGALRVQVVFHGLLGNLTGLLNVGSLSQTTYAGWAPSAPEPSLLALPLLTSTATVVLTSQQTSGSWQVDDVYLDPRVAKLG